MPEVLCLLGQGLDEMGVRIAERCHGDSTSEVEVTGAIGRLEPDALAFFERQLVAIIGRQQRRRHVPLLIVRADAIEAPDAIWRTIQNAARLGGINDTGNLRS